METSEINDKNKRPLHGVYSGNSEYNAVNQQIEARIQRLETMFLGRIDSCQSSGVAGSKTVSATPMIQMVDGNGNAYEAPSYPALPHYRIQQGTAAIIMNPAPGDIGVFICSKRDISNVAQGKQPAPPGSTRSFSPSDAVMVASVHTKVPTYYIDFSQQNKIVIHAPAGVVIETDNNVIVNASNVTVNAPTVKINGSLEVSGTIKSGGQITGSGINFNTHTHSGVQPGSGNTGGPQ